MDYLPQAVVDCTDASRIFDGRNTYACTSSLRVETTILHLILLSTAVLVAALCYAVFQKIMQNRRKNALRGAPAAAAACASAAGGAQTPHAAAALLYAKAAAAAPRALLDAMDAAQQGRAAAAK